MEIKALRYDPVGVYNAYDPTNTLDLRNAFADDLRRRFAELLYVVKVSIGINDCFDLNSINNNQMVPLQPNEFAFLRSEAKIAQFLIWLDEQVRNGIITIAQVEQIGNGISDRWSNIYVTDSYKRGIIRARLEMTKAGMDIPTIDQSGGIDAILNTPFHIDRLGLIFTRVYTDLKGITDAMDSHISRILAQGLADGDGPKLLARKIVSTISGEGDLDKLGITDSLGRFIPAQRRADILARTEIIRAHHQATIQEYMNWRVEKVYVLAEVVTAGDKRVCSRCAALAKGGPYTLEQVMNMIPAHAQCRCCAIPYVKL